MSNVPDVRCRPPARKLEMVYEAFGEAVDRDTLPQADTLEFTTTGQCTGLADDRAKISPVRRRNVAELLSALEDAAAARDRQQSAEQVAIAVQRRADARRMLLAKLSNDTTQMPEQAFGADDCAGDIASRIERVRRLVEPLASNDAQSSTAADSLRADRLQSMWDSGMLREWNARAAATVEQLQRLPLPSSRSGANAAGASSNAFRQASKLTAAYGDELAALSARQSQSAGRIASRIKSVAPFHSRVLEVVATQRERDRCDAFTAGTCRGVAKVSAELSAVSDENEQAIDRAISSLRDRLGAVKLAEDLESEV